MRAPRLLLQRELGSKLTSLLGRACFFPPCGPDGCRMQTGVSHCVVPALVEHGGGVVGGGHGLVGGLALEHAALDRLVGLERVVVGSLRHGTAR